jgi:predicted TIM-barrel fold metal-dependent hydrolase
MKANGSKQDGIYDVPRRSFVAGLAALGASAFLPGCQTAGSSPAAGGGKPFRIDVHHHIAPPGYSAALKSMMRGHAKWSVEASLEDMDKSGIATSITSLINPGMPVWAGDEPGARKIARESNEYAASLARDHPGRFGSFASIPFPYTEGSLREIEYALDTLKADGIYLWTSYGGKLLGDPEFWPINTIEGPVDTTRTMASLMFQGGAARFPDIRWIFSHSGGVTPFLLSRFQRHEIDAKDAKEKMPNGVMHELRKFYYDTAQGNHEGALLALLKIVPTSQVLYGTDFPFRDGAEVIGGLSKYGFSSAQLRQIDSDNAFRLFPRLKA